MEEKDFIDGVSFTVFPQDTVYTLKKFSWGSMLRSDDPNSVIKSMNVDFNKKGIELWSYIGHIRISSGLIPFSNCKKN